MIKQIRNYLIKIINLLLLNLNILKKLYIFINIKNYKDGF